MDFFNAGQSYFTKWIDFKTRSSRSEFFFGTLFVMLTSVFVVLGIVLISSLFNPLEMRQISGMTFITTGNEYFSNIFLIIIQAFGTIAGTSLLVRRLHDVDKSGWWCLIILTVVGALIVVYWQLKKGTDGENRFGADPLQSIENTATQ
jgi:uncharacterized membrane protein YhaH (DUF805 family)|tara:strand:- start:657 stop:1100 length:444 start_codon:yes stop_codon:yes gene_type:complete